MDINNLINDSDNESIDDIYELDLEDLFSDSDVRVSLNTINVE